MSEIMRYTKLTYEAFVLKKGSFKFNPYSMIGKRQLPQRSIEFLRSYLEFVWNAGLLSEISKIYISSIETSVKDAFHTYNQLHEEKEQIDLKKASNHLYYDAIRLKRYFPDTMLKDVIYGKGNLDTYESLLNQAIDGKREKSILNRHSILNIPYSMNRERPDEEKIDEFFRLYAPYTKWTAKEVIEQLPVEVIGYINYLSGKKDLQREEQAILERLQYLDMEIEVE